MKSDSKDARNSSFFFFKQKTAYELFFTSNREKEPYYLEPDSDLYAVPASGGQGKRVVDIDGPIGEFAFSPDGRRIAFRGILNGSPARSYDQPDLFVVDRAPGAKPR